MNFTRHVQDMESSRAVLQELQKNILFLAGRLSSNTKGVEPWMRAINRYIVVRGPRVADRDVNKEAANVLGEIFKELSRYA